MPVMRMFTKQQRGKKVEKIIKYILFFSIVAACVYGIYTYSKIKEVETNVYSELHQGTPDTVKIEGKKDTVIIEKIIYLNKKFFPKKEQQQSGGVPPVSAAPFVIDTTITNGESKINLNITCSPVPDSLVYNLTWFNMEKEITKVDTVIITKVDTLLVKTNVPHSESFFKGAITATGIIGTGYLIYKALAK